MSKNAGLYGCEWCSAMSPEDARTLRSLPVESCIKAWDELEKIGKAKGKLKEAVRELVLADLYYLLVRVCNRVDMLPCRGRAGFVDNQFAFERCREVQDNPDGFLDLWAREHWKSSIITFGLTLHDILTDPEVTFGFFSHTRPIAKAFLRQIQREMESNKVLHQCFPDILWGEDTKQSPKWSEDDGIIVKRKSNPNEATIEAWGLVDGQPTSKHFRKLLYDDVVVAGSVTNEDMIQKVMVEMERSYNLGTTPGVKRAAGTRWHFNDAYRTVAERGTFKLREYPGRTGGEDGPSIVWDENTHKEKRRNMGPYTYAAQILLNPKADALQGFKREWLRYYKSIPLSKALKMSRYLLVDPASSKKKGSDYTSIGVVGLGVDQKYYLLDGIRDRLSLTERAERLFALHRKWKIRLPVRYEKYGMMADIEHIKARQEQENYRFDIVEVGGQTKKNDRIGRLIPLFEQGNFYLPEHLFITNYEKITVDLIRDFIEFEYAAFPVGVHDDFLDMLSRICEPDMTLVWPKEQTMTPEPQRAFKSTTSDTAWMA